MRTIHPLPSRRSAGFGTVAGTVAAFLLGFIAVTLFAAPLLGFVFMLTAGAIKSEFGWGAAPGFWPSLGIALGLRFLLFPTKASTS